MSAVDKCWREVLEKSVVAEKGMLEKGVVEKSWGEVLNKSLVL